MQNRIQILLEKNSRISRKLLNIPSVAQAQLLSKTAKTKSEDVKIAKDTLEFLQSDLNEKIKAINKLY